VTTVEMNTTGDAVVRDLPHDQYLRHPALSASGAKTLARPGGPARFAWERDHPRPPTDAFDLGHLVHGAVLGVGPEVLVVEAPDWRSAAAKRLRDEARAAGRIACLTSDAERVEEMAAAVRRHRHAAALLDPAQGGEPEISCFWHDPAYDVDRRCRVDWMRRPNADGRLILVDLKTTNDASDEGIAKSVFRYAYHQQACFYRDVVVGLGLARSAPMVFVFVEKEPPYLVNVVQLDEPTLRMGEERNARALQLFADCTTSGQWPGFPDDEITTITAPRWAEHQHTEEAASW
jgi:PDDEXK-like domain of unknown function (DUF3799)